MQSPIVVPEENPDTATSKVMVFMICLSGLVGLATWLFFLWGVKDKQFENVEDIATKISELDTHSSVSDAAASQQN